MKTLLCVLILPVLLLVGCENAELVNPAGVTPVTAIPAPDTDNVAAMCTILERERGRNWLRVITVLETLAQTNSLCEDGVSIESQLYLAHLAYGTLLEDAGRDAEARESYQAALEYDSIGEEAAVRLQRLQIATPIPPERCEAGAVTTAIENFPAYAPTEGDFVTLSETGFVLDEDPFPVYGANYYPRETPFAYFLTETNPEVVGAELDIIQRSGINTLRIFLRNDDLFICPGNGAVPIADNFYRLDSIIRIIAEKGFRLIVVLNQNTDLQAFPLYDNPRHVIEQTQFIVERYKDEPAILAWDVRDRGDIDYRSGRFERETVLAWLADMTQMIRQIDPNHPVTAGWWQDSSATAPLVDFVSFQHYGEYEALRQRIAILRDSVQKPILLIAIGYSTFSLDETAQRNLLFQSFEEARHNELAGWLIYMAFDYPRPVTCIEPNCPGDGKDIDHYGLWNTSYFPKLAVDAVKVITGVEDETE
ncbi:MAG: hypothetical protein ACPG7F_10240 [Aggregatilineales bacterium]